MQPSIKHSRADRKAVLLWAINFQTNVLRSYNLSIITHCILTLNWHFTGWPNTTALIANIFSDNFKFKVVEPFNARRCLWAFEIARRFSALLRTSNQSFWHNHAFFHTPFIRRISWIKVYSVHKDSSINCPNHSPHCILVFCKFARVSLTSITI